MEQLTTYRAKGKTIGLVFLFKYDLNGILKLFEIEEGELTDDQMKWLYSPKFPATESIILNTWMKHEKYINLFNVEVSPADLSFEALWELYDYKVSKLDGIKAFNKLKQGDVIKCFIEVPYYLKSLIKNPGIGKLHLSTYISKRRFDDERVITIGKNHNGVLSQLANKKTSK
ncbi:hypothetical protein [Flavobacterium sp.]|uniref:hypothetical protein n=1 Tax=Flavobacterium sp. TaxID=239 RepID=UPI0037505832